MYILPLSILLPNDHIAIALPPPFSSSTQPPKMHIFVTGASGFIGRTLLTELLSAGHTVTALARSPSSVQTITSLGAAPHPGSLTDTASLTSGAAAADAVIHLAFVHDFSNFAASVETDKAAIAALAAGLAGTQRPLIVTSGTLLLPHGRVGTEDDAYDASTGPLAVRGQSEEFAEGLAREKGVRSVVVRLAPVVHGEGDIQFMPAIIASARENRESAYVGEGLNRWPATHVRDAAVAYRLAVEQKVPAGSVLHVVAEGGVRFRDIAEIIGEKLGVPVTSKVGEEVGSHFGWVSAVAGIDNPVSSEKTRGILGWTPKERGLLDDLRYGPYFT